MALEPLRPYNTRTRVVRTVKEIVRHALHGAGVRRSASYLEPADLAGRFTSIYDQEVWVRGDGNNPGSGAGSSVEVASSVARHLPAVLDQLGARSIVDVGCGDFTWMQGVDLTQRYVGVDVVASVIERNRTAHGSAMRHFEVLDATRQAPPGADVVMCREVLFHLSFADARSLLRQAFLGKRTHLIATTDKITMFNSDIETGDYRPLDLRRRPFGLGEPVSTIEDGRLIGGRVLGVWSAAQVRAAAERWT